MFTSAAVRLFTNKCVFKLENSVQSKNRCCLDALSGVYTHTHTLSRGGNDITGFSAMDSLITTLNKQFIKAGFLGSVPAPPRRSSLSCSLLNALKAGIPESIAKHVKPCGDGESEEERSGKKHIPGGCWDCE